MRIVPALVCLLCCAVVSQGQTAVNQFDVHAAERFANLALACVLKEYPNHVSHTMNSDADVAAPRKLTPAFFGCYDWHSSYTGIGYWRGWRGLILMRHLRKLLARRCSTA
jgi:Protein of unknown function (DUF2891)